MASRILLNTITHAPTNTLQSIDFCFASVDMQSSHIARVASHLYIVLISVSVYLFSAILLSFLYDSWLVLFSPHLAPSFHFFITVS
jgi:hypothetical protein